MLNADMISHPELWRCVMMLSGQQLFVALLPPVASDNMLCAILPLNPDAPTPLKALEEAVYDNPLLLCEFRSTHLLLTGGRFTLVPAELTDAADRAMMLAQMWPGAEGEALDPADIRASEPIGGATLLWAPDGATVAFMQRTFFGIRISHALECAMRQAVELSAGPSYSDGVVLLAPEAPGRLTIASARQGSLLTANTFDFASTTDAAYFTLAAVQAAGLDRQLAEAVIAGSGAAPDAIAPALRRYMPHTSRPAPDAALCLYGREAATLPPAVARMMMSYLTPATSCE